MLNKILYFACGLMVLLMLLSCNGENFDITVTDEGEVTVETTELQPGSMEVEIFGIDTIAVLFDSVYCDQINTTVSFFPYVDISVSLKFHSDTNPILLELEEYELIEVQVLEYSEFTNQYVVLWTSTQIEGMVEITESTQFYDAWSNSYFNSISGFVNGTLTDDNGVERTISASFNKINRHSL